jgi:hypothetical protein
MTTTYEMIRALPAKGFDWTGFNAALRTKVIETEAFGFPETLEGWDAAKGVRAVRTAAMEMAAFYVDKVSKRQHIIPPTDESKMWGSFEGGHNLIWIDQDADEMATQEIATLITSFRAMK